MGRSPPKRQVGSSNLPVPTRIVGRRLKRDREKISEWAGRLLEATGRQFESARPHQNHGAQERARRSPWRQVGARKSPVPAGKLHWQGRLWYQGSSLSPGSFEVI